MKPHYAAIICSISHSCCICLFLALCFHPRHSSICSFSFLSLISAMAICHSFLILMTSTLLSNTCHLFYKMLYYWTAYKVLLLKEKCWSVPVHTYSNIHAINLEAQEKKIFIVVNIEFCAISFPFYLVDYSFQTLLRPWPCYHPRWGCFIYL